MKFDEVEFTKFAAVIIAALLLIVGGRVLIEETSHHKQTTVGYVLKAGESDEKAAPVKAKAAFDPSGAVQAMASADTAAGQKAMRKCAACHSWDSGGANKVGPNLWGIVGRKIGGADGFKYSAALSAMDQNWTLENLASFLHKPKLFAKGTAMSFAGIKKDEDLANMLSFLNTLK